MGQALARRTSLYTLVLALSEKLGSIICPYMAALFPQSAADLEGALVAVRNIRGGADPKGDAEGGDNGMKKKKKRKKSTTEALLKTEDTEATLMKDILGMVEQLVGTLRIGFTKCQGQSSSSGKWVDKEKFGVILPLFISCMKLLNESNTLITENFAALIHSQIVVRTWTPHTRPPPPPPPSPFFSRLQTLVGPSHFLKSNVLLRSSRLPLLLSFHLDRHPLCSSLDKGTMVELAVAVESLGGELWKPLNHQVLMLLRSSNPSLKIAALRILQGCFSRIREEYLVRDCVCVCVVYSLLPSLISSTCFT